MSGPVRRPSGTSDAQIAFLLVAAAVLLRAILPVFVDGSNYDGLIPGTPANPDAYRTALREHPFGYLLYNHVLPVLFTAKNALLHNILPGDWVTPAWYGLLVILDGATAALAFLFLRGFGISRVAAITVAAAVSLRLLPWETVNWGGGWDAFNPFLVMLYAWSVARLILAPDAGRTWAACASGALLVAGFQFGLPIVAASAIGALILMAPRKGTLRAVTALAVLPAVVAAAVIAKNAVQHNLWSMSSGAGQNVFQNLNMALSDPAGHGGLKFGIAQGYPDWWAWCYREAERRGAHPVPNVAGFYGACMWNQNGTRDYAALEEYFRAQPNPNMAAILASDLDIQAYRPWLWAGPVALRATGVSLAYGTISQRLLFDIAAAYPRRFAGRTWLNLTRHFLGETRHFLVDRNRARFAEPRSITFLNRLFGLLFPVGFGAACLYFAAVAVRRLLSFAGPRWEPPDTRLQALGLVSTGFLAVAAISALMACCENHRHAFCYLPVALCLGSILIRDALKGIGRIPQLRRLR